MNRKYAIHGIIGCVLFGIGDWLLGYVDPGEVTGDVFYDAAYMDDSDRSGFIDNTDKPVF